MQLSIATCQFPTSADTYRNFQYVSQLMRHAREQGADVAHFPEACLSGYAGADLARFARALRLSHMSTRHGRCLAPCTGPPMVGSHSVGSGSLKRTTPPTALWRPAGQQKQNPQ
jgi:predicted amidohydrolase